jgi:hypothetical protein
LSGIQFTAESPAGHLHAFMNKQSFEGSSFFIHYRIQKRQSNRVPAEPVVVAA